MAKTRSKRNKAVSEDAQHPLSHADIGGDNQTTQSQAERNSINKAIAEEQERRRRMGETETTPSQTAGSDDLNDPDVKRRDAEEANKVALHFARRFDATKAAIEANQDPAVVTGDVIAARKRFDEDAKKKHTGKEKDETTGDPVEQGVQPVLVTEGNVPQTSINSRTTTVDPRTTTITNRRDGNPPTGETELALRSASVSGRIDGAPAHVPPDAVDRVRGVEDSKRRAVLHGGLGTGIAGIVQPIAPRARPLGETSLKEAQGLPHVGEGILSGVVGVIPAHEMERHDAPTQNVSGSKSVFVHDTFQQALDAEKRRQELVAESKAAQEQADQRKERQTKLKRRKIGAPRAKGNKGKRKTRGGSKH